MWSTTTTIIKSKDSQNNNWLIKICFISNLKPTIRLIRNGALFSSVQITNNLIVYDDVQMRASTISQSNFILLNKNRLFS